MRTHRLQTSHTTLAHLVCEYTYEGFNEPILGLDEPITPSAINADEVLAAIEHGKDPAQVAVHLEPNSAVVWDRDDLAALFRRNGVHRLARQITRAICPADAFLVVVNTEEESSVRYISLSQLRSPHTQGGA